jgi:hypothetical protein
MRKVSRSGGFGDQESFEMKKVWAWERFGDEKDPEMRKIRR